MAKKDRLLVGGELQNFTCRNQRFQTDIITGFAHSDSTVLGSALPGPLAESEGFTLWLEHVIDTRFPENNQKGLFWLMWYQDGIPIIPMSGVLTADDIRRMTSLLSDFHVDSNS